MVTSSPTHFCSTDLFPSRTIQEINSRHLSPDMLIGKYTPNLIAKLFSVSHQYARMRAFIQLVKKIQKTTAIATTENFTTLQTNNTDNDSYFTFGHPHTRFVDNSLMFKGYSIFFHHDSLNVFSSVYQVDDTLYKVHRYFLARESAIFQMMFDCPHPTEGQDGENDEKPIYLPGVSCLRTFFTTERNVPKSNPRTFYDLLSISLRFELDRVTRKVVAYIDGCADDTDPVTKICLGFSPALDTTCIRCSNTTRLFF
ncbi:hypothetical protein BYT27DRAFT_6408822 [Phlegmacium glaucopus]|nr:hypothetical protein BYT27DRAFT_6408822 [Phlegmacium glaucopus]